MNNNKNKVSEEKLFFSNWTFSFLNLKFLDIKEERSIECKLFDALIFEKIKKKQTEVCLRIVTFYQYRYNTGWIKLYSKKNNDTCIWSIQWNKIKRKYRWIDILLIKNQATVQL